MVKCNTLSAVALSHDVILEKVKFKKLKKKWRSSSITVHEPITVWSKDHWSELIHIKIYACSHIIQFNFLISQGIRGNHNLYRLHSHIEITLLQVKTVGCILTTKLQMQSQNIIYSCLYAKIAFTHLPPINESTCNSLHNFLLNMSLNSFLFASRLQSAQTTNK